MRAGEGVEEGAWGGQQEGGGVKEEEDGGSMAAIVVKEERGQQSGGAVVRRGDDSSRNLAAELHLLSNVYPSSCPCFSTTRVRRNCPPVDCCRKSLPCVEKMTALLVPWR